MNQESMPEWELYFFQEVARESSAMALNTLDSLDAKMDAAHIRTLIANAAYETASREIEIANALYAALSEQRQVAREIVTARHGEYRELMGWNQL